MKYLGNFFFIFIYRLQLRNHQPNPGTKSMYSTLIALKNLQLQKKVLQVLRTRGSSFFAHGVLVMSFMTS